MGAQDLGLGSMLSLLVFLGPVFYIIHTLKLGIHKTLVKSIARMCLQLGFVGIYLEFIFRLNSALVNTAYLLVMVAIACHTILKSSGLRLKVFFGALFCSLLLPFSVILLFFNSFVVGIDNLFDAKYLVPVGGMILGNCLRCIIIGLDRFYTGLKKNEKTYIYSLGLFNNRMQALKPFLKESITAGITPTVASMATIGLVSLPGMMTGQILGGSIPLVAIKYQIAIMFSIFYTEFFSLILAILFSLGAGFDSFDMLKKHIFLKAH